MKKFLLVMILANFLLFPVLFPAMSLATVPAPAPPEVAPTVFLTGAELVAFIVRIGNWIFAILLAVAGAFLIYAGFLFVTAAGDAEKITQARGILINGLIGVAIALLARGLVAALRHIVGVGGG